MAQKIKVELIDDLANGDGQEVEAAETVSFGLDGSSYEIDLTSENAKALREALASYIAVARPVARRSSGGGRSHAKSAVRKDLGAVREWARAAGYEVSDRGRVRADILEAYDRAH
ncbi:Lsr2 family protein [Janibacter sp. GXQ6167]|uniref:histone-like nucleoid-structuring protein Lsr2 n=1 Tax=Janibacter sp. GXQ6167 TaxID=3240791 RepID=UPI003523EBB1